MKEELEKARNLKTRKERKKETLRLRKKYNDDSIVIYSKKHKEGRKESISKKEKRELLKDANLVNEVFAI